jgi:hypothetical protein
MMLVLMNFLDVHPKHTIANPSVVKKIHAITTVLMPQEIRN